jgi:hypothetical protein
MIQFRDSILPLFAVKLENGTTNSASDFRYLGSSYHVNDQGIIATCKHVVEAIQEGETLCGMEMFGEGLMFNVLDIKCHPKYDFAIGYVARKNYKAIPMHGEKDLFIAQDVLAYGFTNEGLIKGRLVTSPRLFKGHIVRTFDQPILEDARSTCEISFPALKGFSGTPLLFDSKKSSVAGMLFSNMESSIELHRLEEIEEHGEVFSEKIHKVLELGVVHTAWDIRHFLKDLGVTRIPFGKGQKLDEIET